MPEKHFFSSLHFQNFLNQIPFNPVKMCFLEEEWDVRLKIRKWNEENWYPFPSLSPKTKDVGCFRQNSTWSRPRAATYLILTYDYKYFVFPREATYETKMKWKSLLMGSFGQKNLPITKKYVCRNTQEKSLVFFYIRENNYFLQWKIWGHPGKSRDVKREFRTPVSRVFKSYP